MECLFLNSNEQLKEKEIWKRTKLTFDENKTHFKFHHKISIHKNNQNKHSILEELLKRVTTLCNPLRQQQPKMKRSPNHLDTLERLRKNDNER